MPAQIGACAHLMDAGVHGRVVAAYGRTVVVVTDEGVAHAEDVNTVLLQARPACDGVERADAPRFYQGRSASTIGGTFAGVDQALHLSTPDPFYDMAGRVAVLNESIGRELTCILTDGRCKVSDAVTEDAIETVEKAMAEAIVELHRLSHDAIEMHVAGLFEAADAAHAEQRRQRKEAAA
ncbi:MAG: hypothetical protein AAGJ54_07410 [Planctomycetota bacterium]